MRGCSHFGRYGGSVGDGRGRIVLENPVAMLSALQDRLAAAREGSDETAESMVDSLLADRAADTSF